MSEEGHSALMADYAFVLRNAPAQLPDQDRIVNFCISQVQPLPADVEDATCTAPSSACYCFLRPNL